MLAAAFAAAGRADRARPSAADRATAKRDLLRLSDLPTTVTWKATTFSSKSSGTPASCSRLDSPGAAVVDTADAASQFSAPGILAMNMVGLVATSHMLDVSWQHTFGSSPARCLRDSFAQGSAGHLKIIDSAALALPRVAPRQEAYRMLFTMNVKGVTEYGAFDMVAMGGDRTMSLLFVGGLIGPASERSAGETAMSVIDLRLAQILASRAFKGTSGLTA
jgi:hypothetical protein